MRTPSSRDAGGCRKPEGTGVPNLMRQLLRSYFSLADASPCSDRSGSCSLTAANLHISRVRGAPETISTMEPGMLQTIPEPKWNTLPKAGCVNRRYPPPAFLVALRLSFSNAGSEPLLCRRFETEMLLRHGPVYNNSPERRAMRRFSMRLPASVRVPGIPSPFATDSENVSARGIFFYIDRLMKEGSQIEVTMDFPSQVTLTDPLRVRFLARVLRAEPESAVRVGVAAAIDEYEFLRPEPADSTGLQPGWNLGTTG